MEVKVRNFKVLDHSEASLLLPWLGTGRLEAGELEPLLDHLKVCKICRGDLRDLAELGRSAELAERGEAPDAAAIERRLERLVGRLGAPAGPRRLATPPIRSSAVGWRQALPLAALVVLAVGLFFFTSTSTSTAERPGPAGALYTTLSSPEEPGPVGSALRVVIADACTQGELRRLLGEAGAEIHNGPSRLGVYTIGLPDGALPDAQIAAWRPLACFSFVDKATGGPAAGDPATADRTPS